MRPRRDGIPKILLTITDGLSGSPAETKLQADRIRKREFNMISIGVGVGAGNAASAAELSALSSTPNAQFYADDVDQLFVVIDELTYTNCRTATSIETDSAVETKVQKDKYKYFKYPVDAESKDLTIELEQLSGLSQVFFSFENENPKSENDLVKINSEDNQRNENFYEVVIEQSLSAVRSRVSELESGRVESVEAQQRSQIAVTNADGYATLYISVKGYEENNSFRVSVFNKSVAASSGQTRLCQNAMQFLLSSTFISLLFCL